MSEHGERRGLPLRRECFANVVTQVNADGSDSSRLNHARHVQQFADALLVLRSEQFHAKATDAQRAMFERMQSAIADIVNAESGKRRPAAAIPPE